MAQNTEAGGMINRIAGPVIGAVGYGSIRLHDMVMVGEAHLVGEVIRLNADQVTIQVYEETSGLRMGEPIYNTGQPLVAYLGPGLMGQIFDGLQRPLSRMAIQDGVFLQSGISQSSLDTEKLWEFTPQVNQGDLVSPGCLLGSIPETSSILHRVLVPAGLSGRIADITSGQLTVTDSAATIETEQGDLVSVPLGHYWPVRKPRPYAQRLDLNEPLITGKRIVDLFFPIPKGGTAIIPGGFGTGKTVIQQSLARWSAVDVVVYVGCGERGNEMAEVLNELPQLEDRATGVPLINRTVLIANTSNMPVAAREASIYMGITIAEYYRDMGYNVLMLADSTSRWGEALREVSSRLEEIPGEEGYPAYLASRLAEFYERAGHVTCLGAEKSVEKQSHCEGSISIVGAVSPPGGDFSDPITQASMRIAGVFWALDYELSRRRHFPAINWNSSFSLIDLSRWYRDAVADDFPMMKESALAILGREHELQQVVQLIGQDALSDLERETLLMARVLREDLLQQSAIHTIDAFCSIEKSYLMLKAIMHFHQEAQQAMAKGVLLEDIETTQTLTRIGRMKELPLDDLENKIQYLTGEISNEFKRMLNKLEMMDA